MSTVKFLANLIFKKNIQKQKGIMKILPGDKVDAEKKAEFAIKKLKERANINVNNLSKSDLEFLAEDIVNPFKYAEKTPIKSADVIPFKFKRTFAEELADASKKGDFTRMKGIMQLDPKFKEIIKNFKKSKADEEAYNKMVGPKKLIPDRDVIPYQSPPVQSLSPAEKLKQRTTLTEAQYKDVLKHGKTIDDVIYAQDFYGDTAEDVIKKITEKEKFPFADGGVAGLLGERTGFAGGGNENGEDDGITGITMSIEERMERIRKLLKQMQDIKKGVGIDPDPEDMADGGVAGLLGERVGFRFGSRGYQGGRNTGVSRGGNRSAAMGMGSKQRGGTFSQGALGGSGSPTHGGSNTPHPKKKTTKVATAIHGGLAKRGYGVARRG